MVRASYFDRDSLTEAAPVLIGAALVVWVLLQRTSGTVTQVPALGIPSIALPVPMQPGSGALLGAQDPTSQDPLTPDWTVPYDSGSSGAAFPGSDDPIDPGSLVDPTAIGVTGSDQSIVGGGGGAGAGP
jgi:hypothetical protein